MTDEQRDLDATLEAMDEASFAEYKTELEKLDQRDRAHRRAQRRAAERSLRWGSFLNSVPGHPLGKGMPSGKPIGPDAPHSERWRGVLRLDVCAYCGRSGGTVDHIIPRAIPQREQTMHTWLNWTGACGRCNVSKGAQSLLGFMLKRANQPAIDRAHSKAWKELFGQRRRRDVNLTPDVRARLDARADELFRDAA